MKTNIKYTPKGYKHYYRIGSGLAGVDIDSYIEFLRREIFIGLNSISKDRIIQTHGAALYNKVSAVSYGAINATITDPEGEIDVEEIINRVFVPVNAVLFGYDLYVHDGGTKEQVTTVYINKSSDVFAIVSSNSPTPPMVLSDSKSKIVRTMHCIRTEPNWSDLCVDSICNYISQLPDDMLGHIKTVFRSSPNNEKSYEPLINIGVEVCGSRNSKKYRTIVKLLKEKLMKKEKTDATKYHYYRHMNPSQFLNSYGREIGKTLGDKFDVYAKVCEEAFTFMMEPTTPKSKFKSIFTGSLPKCVIEGFKLLRKVDDNMNNTKSVLDLAMQHGKHLGAKPIPVVPDEIIKEAGNKTVKLMMVKDTFTKVRLLDCGADHEKIVGVILFYRNKKIIETGIILDETPDK